ncbi:MAG: lamin tail domain-containing protein [Verrucomicrobiota bacterium]
MTLSFSNSVLNFATGKRNFINAYFSTNLTMTTGGFPSSEDYTVINVGSLLLNGNAPQGYTAEVRVNGSPANWDTQTGQWNMPAPTVFSPGPNDVTVEAIDSEGRVIKSLTRRFYFNFSPVAAAANINVNTTWSPGSTVVVSSDVNINSSATLTINAGTLVLVNNGARINVQDGTLTTLGTADDPVYFASGNANTPWSITGLDPSSRLLIGGIYAEGGRLALTNAQTFFMSDSEMRGHPGTMLSAWGVGGTSFLSFNTFGDYGQIVFVNSDNFIEHCLFEGFADWGFIYSGNNAMNLMTRCTFRDGPGIGLAMAGDTQVTADHHLFQRVGTAAAVWADNATGTFSDSLIEQCQFGLLESTSAGPLSSRLTIVDGVGGYTGTNGMMTNSILVGLTNPVVGPMSDIRGSNIELPDDAIQPGGDNINRNPWFRDPDTGDYRLQAISPGITDHVGEGADFPVGANPASPTGLTAVLSGPLQVMLTWSDESTVEEWFHVERSTNGVTWEVVAQLPANTVSHVDTGLAQDTVYDYRLRAGLRRGVSYFSNIASARTLFGSNGQNLVDYLQVTEIMYHPAIGSLDDDEYEFLELKNTGPVGLDLSGASFSEGLEFVFTNTTILLPGDFYILVRNPAAFSERYPSITPDGVYSNSGLSNSDDELELQDSEGGTIFSFTYVDSWYDTTDGDGYSLVVADPTDADEASGWRPSTDVHGSPGADDPVPAFGTILINEVLAHTDNPLEDAIELINAGTNVVNIGGWYLSDDEDLLKKFRIPDSTFVLPGSNVVFVESQFNPDTNLPTSFSLSELGDRVILSSADAGGNLTAWRTEERFGASDQGDSFGRWATCDGEVDFTLLDFRTLGGPNASPRIGPVAINEIMYNPDGGGEEFIELLNRTGSMVPLFDPLNPTNTWEFDGAMEYVFPTNTWLAPGELMLLVDIDPAEFRSRFGIDTNVVILGPWSGDLSNGGESIKLYQPGDPEPNGFVPRILTDRVNYNDRLPWPEEADGDGPSLERVDPNTYGNDACNWTSYSIGGTPGRPNVTSNDVSIAFADDASFELEGNRSIWITVSLQPPSARTSIVSYAVSGGTAGGSDFTLAPGTLTFWPFDTEKQIRVDLHEDFLVEPDETIEISLSQPTNAILGGQSEHVVTLTDLDGGTLAAPTMIPPSQTFFCSVLVTITSFVNGAQIYYTTDGSDPDTSSKLYTGPVFVGDSLKLKAVAFRGGYRVSGHTEGTFTRIASGMNDGDGDGIPDVWECLLINFDDDDLFQDVTDISFSSDYDGDLLSDGAEYVAGTDPTDPESYLFTTISQVGTQQVVTAYGIKAEGVGYEGMDRFYSYEQAFQVMSNDWTTVPGFTNLFGRNRFMNYTNTVVDPDARGYFRIRAWLQ